MKELTLEELDKLTKRIEDYPPSMTPSNWTQRELPALLAMARELIRIRSALEYITKEADDMAQSNGIGGRILSVKFPFQQTAADALLAFATSLGWLDPLSPAATPVAELKGGEG